MLDELSTEDYCSDDGTHLTSKEIYTYLTEVLYNRRNKCAPQVSSLAGISEPFAAALLLMPASERVLQTGWTHSGTHW